jgi:hypothetical protein
VTHDELVNEVVYGEQTRFALANALRAVVELHRPTYDFGNGHCLNCAYAGGELMSYPCPTIQAIEKELK